MALKVDLLEVNTELSPPSTRLIVSELNQLGGYETMMESLQKMWLNTSLRLKGLKNDQSGVTTVEYAVMLVLVAIAVIIAAPNISSAVIAVFTQIATKLQPVG